ncbi:MAG: diaminopimelate decarboxylase [Candidatus Thiodiazotropha sp. (ex Lucina aurantia)]|uniref:Diaminopimelate decarboxylase n=2 Tax=Candidatus Thiodiazotropha TaxID=1913444 RepID=A0A7Z0VN83_9GAMM|nr:diaminopimelate decarboxylase [Candidatus Thiodiazotropha endolucinida]MBT3011412.1 diaminopimelate decarboxylase [Candidatus Thiodiazotropha sp. (ex Lucina pensylvanica)]MBT3015030.1 diaminopimelate decarboxylase [Candidatus Thiodiazotropha taylori]MBT3038369.1 diaminopimelate decarboxylase [Candidatus Thiodiazotropha sp. (ex Codakia orbicularis)]MBV2102940.1 diaminopimelate decarboxylase [Candidatus Thiodiazotropha sp. (ex Lucina aurantia)]MBT3023163.1 diaminopimelate decarboxylase [Candi
MPISAELSNRLAGSLEEIVEHFGTPFHLYDEKGIRENGEALIRAFEEVESFREYFAVKALPNPTIMKIMQDLGFGFDCSSIAELLLSRQIGASGEQIMFTSNNTSAAEFAVAEADGGCVLNLDDISLIDKVPRMPELICFRYNPGERRSGNSIIGNPIEAKYGVAHDQLLEAYQKAMQRGARRFGLHTMLASNELNHAYMVETARMLLDRVVSLSEKLGIQFEFINIGGGLGIPYRPQEKPLDIVSMGREIADLFRSFKAHHGYAPKLFLESGRYITGPYGVLITRAINRKEIYRTYVGVDSCMSSLMRPGMYGAYHHISVLGKQGEQETVDVVGSLCENNDKFAVQRPLPAIQDGDILIIHDAGAHGHAMGFNYNGKTRPKELLLRSDGSVDLIRREETIDDIFTTLNFEPDRFIPG